MNVSNEGSVPPRYALSSFTRVRRANGARRTRGSMRRFEDRAWRVSARVASVLPLAGLGFILVVLVVKAWPATKVNGGSFLTSSQWVPGSTYGAVVHTSGVAHPAGSAYGAWPLIAGTLETSFIALLIALPI